MWLVFSILTVLLWGTSDVIFKSCSRNDEDSVAKLLAFNGIVLGSCSFIYVLAVGFVPTFDVVVKYLPIALIYIVSMFFYYKTMPLIEISIASPVANTSCVLTTLLCVFILKQPINALQIAAVAMIAIGIVLMSLERTRITGSSRRGYILGLLFAFVYFVLDGTGSFLDDYVLGSELSAEGVIFAYGAIYFVIGVGCFIYLKVKDRSYVFTADKKKLLGSIVETAGQFTYVYAFAEGNAAIASPFIASFSAVSVILSRIFLKEKLSIQQYIAAVMMLCGMAILAI